MKNLALKASASVTNYSKLVVYLLTAVMAYVQLPHLTWKAAVLGGVGAVLLWLVPNSQTNSGAEGTPKSPAPENPS